MKKTFLCLSLTCVLLLSLNSCNKEEIINNDNSSLKTEFKQKASNFILNKSKTSKSSNSNNLTEQEIQDLSQTSLDLIKSYGLSEQEISEDLNGVTNEKLVEAAMGIIAIEEEASLGIELYDPNSNISWLTGNEMNYLSAGKTVKVKSEVFHCAMEAIGINALGEIITNGIKGMGKSAVKRLLKSVASKYLGAIGATIALYEFGDCMDWW